MNRRNFIRLAMAGALGTAFDWDKLLWVPGAKRIFIPNPSIITLLERKIAIAYNKMIPRLELDWYNAIMDDNVSTCWDAKEKVTITKHIPAIYSQVITLPELPWETENVQS